MKRTGNDRIYAFGLCRNEAQTALGNNSARAYGANQHCLRPFGPLEWEETYTTENNAYGNQGKNREDNRNRGIQVELSKEQIREISAQRHQIALGKVHNARSPQKQDKSHGNHCVSQSYTDAGNCLL